MGCIIIEEKDTELAQKGKNRMGQNAVKNKIRLKICDIECVVNSEDNEDYVRALGYDVERTIQELMGQNGRVSLAMAATIAALSYCDDVHKEITNSDNLRAQIKQYLDEATAAKEEAEHLRVENENLRVGMDELCADISDLKVQLGAMSNALLSKSSLPSSEKTLTPILEEDQMEKEQDEPVEIGSQEPEESAAQETQEIEAQEVALESPAQMEEEADPQNQAEELQPRDSEPVQPKIDPLPQPSKPTPPQAPLRRNPTPQPVQMGSYARPKSPFEPDLPSADGFVSFFEKK